MAIPVVEFSREGYKIRKDSWLKITIDPKRPKNETIEFGELESPSQSVPTILKNRAPCFLKNGAPCFLQKAG